MPTFNSKFDPRFLPNKPSGADGVSPKQFLQYGGAKVPVIIAMRKNLAAELDGVNQNTPPIIESYGLIDTAAKASCIDIELAAHLGLPILEQTYITTPSHDSVQADIFSGMIIQIRNADGMMFKPRGLIGAILQNQNYGILLGRDFLAECRLVYDGPKGEFTISCDS